MKLTEGRLRAALLETAEEIPPGAVPPLQLPSADLRSVVAGGRWPAGRAGGCLRWPPRQPSA
jgi:hypothetical protein